MKASAELDSPKDSLISPTFTMVSGSSGLATSGNRKIRKGTNSADPLIPTVFTIVAPSMKQGNSHQ